MPPLKTLILDGIWGSSHRFKRLRAALEAHCGPTDLFPYDTSGTACLDTTGAQLAQAIRRCPEPVNLLAFSMGGLVARAAHRLDPTLPVRRAVFLNSPHRGSWWCHLARPFKRLRSLAQMRPGSAFLSRLAEVDWKIPTLAVWCPFDLIVFPGTSARWKAAHEVVRCAFPLHEWPIYSRTLHRRIATFLSGADSVV